MIKNTQRHTGNRARETDAAELAERRIEKLVAHLPNWLADAIRWIRRPAARWVRIPVALLFFAGGFLAFLPVFGMWMLPLSFILLAEDIPPLRHMVERCINWTAERRPHWFQ